MKIPKVRVLRILIFLLAVILKTFFNASFGTEKVYAIDISGNGSVDLTLFVTPLTAKSQAGFPISTGEFIQYALAPNDVTGQTTIRMFKNREKNNWEQFVNEGNFIRRREDTSWAPAPAGEPGAPDVFCENGHRAVYTLINDGQPISGNAKWLPNTINFTSFIADYDARDITIQPVDRTAMDARVSCTLKGSLAPVYPASGQRQQMKLTYHPAGTFALCSGLVNEEDLIDILVTEGFGKNDHFYFMKNWGFVGFSDPTGRNAGLCNPDGSCGTCAVGGGITPGPGGGPVGDVIEPDCPSSPYELTIYGTVKSSKTFYQTVNAMTDETVFLEASEDIAGLPYVTNVPVNGAVVGLHDSQKMDWRKDQGHTNSSGFVDGMLKQPYVTMNTKPDGTFKITAKSHCGEHQNVYRSDWRGTGYEQYLTVSCADKTSPTATATVMIKDVLGYVLSSDLAGKDDNKVTLPDLTVDCQAIPWKTYPTATRPNGLAKFLNMSKDVYLACSGDPSQSLTERAIAGVGASGYNYDIDHIYKDEWSAPNSFLGWLRDVLNFWNNFFGNRGDARNPSVISEWLYRNVPFNGRTEHRLDSSAKHLATESLSVVKDVLVGIVSETAQKPRFFYNPASGGGANTFTGGQEEKLDLSDCEAFKRCNSTLSEDDHPLDNMQTCGGMGTGLGTPFGNVIKDSAGKIDPYLSGEAIRYRILPKTRKVCKDIKKNLEVTVADIMPPEGYCGDIDGKNGIEETFEMPCPQYFSCGDQNGDGYVLVADGERGCDTVQVQNSTLPGFGRPGYYSYDIRYFPYSLLYNTDTVNISESEGDLNVTTNDSYDQNSQPRSGGNPYDPAEDAGGVSKPGNKAGIPETFATEVKTKIPCTDDLCPRKVLNLGSTEITEMFPLSNLAGTPYFASSSNSQDILNTSVEGNASLVSSTTSDIGNFYRVGVPDQLCVCSIVENGDNTAKPALGLKNCQIDAQLSGVGPTAKEPANLMDPTRDQMVGGQGGNDSHLSGDYGLLFNNEQADLVAGGTDYEEKDLPGDVGPVRHVTGFHYSQAVSNVTSALKDLLEFFSCALNPNDNGNQSGANPRCGREIRVTSKNSKFSDKSFTEIVPKNVTGSFMILDTPSFVENQLQIKLGGMTSSAATKTELTKDGNPGGFDITRMNSAMNAGEVPGSQGTAYIEQKSGYDPWGNSWKLRHGVSTPIWTGQETPACRMVPGWQVDEMGTFPNGEGLFTADCLDDASKCWVGGAVKNEDWGGAKSLIMSGSPSSSGISWTPELNKSGGFVHGLSAYTGGNIATAGSITYNTFSGSWSPMIGVMKMLQPRADSTNTSTTYTGFLYDVAGGLGGYIATGTGHVFYSSDGKSNWNVISKKDSVTGLTGCESPDWPYGCKTYECNPTTGVCTDCNADGSGGKPRCCCKGYSTDPLADADGNPLTPNCPDGASGTPHECWLWEDSSIWGVDCNKATGDCIVAGQSGAHVWSAPKSGLSDAGSWTRVNLGGGHAMNVSFPGGSENVAYVVGASGNGCDATGGFIKKSKNGGASWNETITQPGTDSGYRGIDCFDADHCAISGTHGVIKITADGGQSWKDWGEKWTGDPLIDKAKTDGVRFWDIAYPNENTIVAVGYKPKTPYSSACDSTPSGDEVIGVVYTLGEREDCEESGGGPSCSLNTDECTGGSTMTWSSGPTEYYSGTGLSLVHITGTYKFRDAGALHLEPSSESIFSPCARTGSSIGGYSGSLVLYVRRGGEGERTFELDTQSCHPVGEVKLDFYLPEDSEYAVTSSERSYHSGTGGNCGDIYPRVYYPASTTPSMCGYSWSEMTCCGVSCDDYDTEVSCGVSQECNYDYNKVAKCRDGGGLGCSGSCYAASYGYTLGGVPCGDERPLM